MKYKILIIGIITIISARLYMFQNTGVKVVIQNSGSKTLYDLSVQVTGKMYSLGNIPSGEIKSVVVNPKGESNIEIEHGKGSRKKILIDCYIEPGYKGKIKIDLDSDKILNIENKIGI